VKPSGEELVIEKNFPNSFRNTALKEALERLQATNLVVAGMMTHMCIDASVRHAADLGYKITLLADACATRAQSYGGETVRRGRFMPRFAALGFYVRSSIPQL
jgi:nicotinamidase-related amidase